jgi:CheY-like chemotaxis protein
VPQILGDETQIHQVLLNVCLNARDAMPKGGLLTLGAERVERRKGLYVRLTVRDTGVGMDEETQSRIFDPFFTTKKAGQGTGLGLYMAYRVIERHGGQVDVVSSPGKGTTVTILLPASGTRASVEPAAGEPSGASQGGTVLLVDDEDLMREVGAEMLQRLSYSVLTAADGREALGLVERLGREIRCVILDIAMPVMNGWEAARAIRRLHPDMPIVVSSGHDLSPAKGDSHGVEGALFLKKPYRLADLDALLKAIPREGPRAPAAP